MARSRKINLLFPSRGLDRRSSYENQPPYSTPDCQNVRPFDTIEDRERGGSRPGLLKAYKEELGSGNKVNMLSTVSVTEDSGFRQFSENFQLLTLENNGWSPVASYSSNMPDIYDVAEAAISYQDVTAKAGAIKDALDPGLDETQAYTVELNCVPFEGSFAGKYLLWAAADDTTPDPYDEGLVCELIMNDATDSYSGNLYHYSGGTLQNTYAFTGFTGTDNAKTRKLWLRIEGTSIKAYVDSTLETSQTISLTSPSTHRRVGFAFEATVEGGACMAESFMVQYFTDESLSTQDREIMIASSNGAIYKETFEGVMELVSTTLTLNSNERIRAEDFNEKLYIADYGDVAADGTDGAIASSNQLSAVSVADWTALGLNTNDFVVVVTDTGGATVAGTYEITAIAAGFITLSGTPGDGTCSYHIERGPKIFDPSDDSLVLWTATTDLGQVPTGSKLIARYRGRVVLTGGRLWYMSRQFDLHDWDYGASDTDYGRAVAGQNSDAGEIGKPITSLMPHHDDYLVFGGERSLYILRADPTLPGASLGPISTTVGVVGGDAWTEIDDGSLMILSHSGMYMVPPGGAGRPQHVSRRIPRELKNLLHEQYQVSLAYDSRDEGVHLFVQQDGVTQTHWWVDLQTKGFFPVKTSQDHTPYSVYIHNSSVQDKSDVLLGCMDGYIRRFSELQNTDDGTEIESYVLIGPFRLGTDHGREGILESFNAVLGYNSGSVDWSIQVDESVQKALLGITQDSGTWDNPLGVQFTDYPKIRGVAAFLRLDNSGVVNWALEKVTTKISTFDDQRLL